MPKSYLEKKAAVLAYGSWGLGEQASYSSTVKVRGREITSPPNTGSRESSGDGKGTNPQSPPLMMRSLQLGPPLNLPKQRHQLEIKHSDTRAYMGQYSLKPLQRLYKLQFKNWVFFPNFYQLKLIKLLLQKKKVSLFNLNNSVSKARTPVDFHFLTSRVAWQHCPWMGSLSHLLTLPTLLYTWVELARSLFLYCLNLCGFEQTH